MTEDKTRKTTPPAEGKTEAELKLGEQAAASAEGKGDRSPEMTETEQLQSDIETTREEMGDTVEALAAKTDVKAQAKKQAAEAKAQAQEKVADAKTKVTGAKDDLLGKARNASPEAAKTAVTQASQKARENPLPVAIVGAAAVGFLVGRLSKR
jgi:ElaB/YqjD/DUF883 family membrane-anchored ribosome-binding protein